MVIKILGKGCKKCGKLEENARQAAKEKGIEATFEKVTDINDIAEYGVMQTPALVIDESVKVAGRVPSAKAIAQMLE